MHQVGFLFTQLYRYAQSTKHKIKYLALTAVILSKDVDFDITLLWYLLACNLVEIYRSFRRIVIFIVTPKISFYPKHVYVKNALFAIRLCNYLFVFRVWHQPGSIKLAPHLLRSWAMNECSDTQFGKLHYIINHKRLHVIRPTVISCRLSDHLI